MKAYLAGPMSGYEEHNFPAFREAAVRLRALGHEIISPVEMDEESGFDEKGAQAVASGSAQWAEFLARDIQVVARPDVDAVIVLDGWQRSKGALLETHVARELGKPILRYPSMSPIYGEERIVNPETGGAKGRKPQRFELLPWDSLSQVAEVYAFGASKYEDHNWRKGYAWSLSYGAMIRHLAAFWSGEDTDPESGLPHVAHAGFHVLTLLAFMNDHGAHDDRP